MAEILLRFLKISIMMVYRDLITDDFLAYVFSSFAFSASGQIILKYSNHEYRVMSMP